MALTCGLFDRVAAINLGTALPTSGTLKVERAWIILMMAKSSPS